MRRQVGDRVRLIRRGSVYWFTGPHMGDRPMPITGSIVEIDFDHYVGESNCPFRIKFDDSRESWYATKEIRKTGR